MSKQNQKSDEQKPAQSTKELIARKKEQIIQECRLLATFKVSSAAHINERTKELLKLEGAA